MKREPYETAVHQRRTRFIKEFLVDQNATRAAKAAGYSEKTAAFQASRLLNNVKIQAEIQSALDKVNAKLDVTVERVTHELARLAFYDPGAYWNPDGSAKAFGELSEDARRAIAGFEMAELFQGKGEERGLAGYIKKFKLADKGANLERLGRHLQMFPTKVEVTGSIVHKIDDGDLNTRIAELERELGLAAAIDEAGRVGIAQAGTEKTNGHAQTTDVLPGNGTSKA